MKRLQNDVSILYLASHHKSSSKFLETIMLKGNLLKAERERDAANQRAEEIERKASEEKQAAMAIEIGAVSDRARLEHYKHEIKMIALRKSEEKEAEWNHRQVCPIFMSYFRY